MTEYLKNGEIDKDKWDAFIASSSHPLVYAKSWFLDIVSPGWNALIMDDYSAVFPLTQNRKYGFSYLRQPAFCQQLGIFSNKSNSNVEEAFFGAIPKKYRLIDISLNASNTYYPANYKIKKNVNLELHLAKTYRELYLSFSENTRRNIRKTTNQRFELRTLTTVNKLTDLFRQNRGKLISNFPTSAYEILNTLTTKSLAIGSGILTGVFHAQTGLCAGAFFLRAGNRFIFLFSANNQSGKNTGAMYFLINEFIRQYAGTKYILDFEGSNDAGLARFYRGFGSTETNYLSVLKNNLPIPFRFFK